VGGFTNEIRSATIVKTEQLVIGAKVKVPWGIDRFVDAEVVEVWGDPAQHVRVRLHLGDTEGEDQPVILLSPSIIEAA
jgi:hypothetical protein